MKAAGIHKWVSQFSEGQAEQRLQFLHEAVHLHELCLSSCHPPRSDHCVSP